MFVFFLYWGNPHWAAEHDTLSKKICRNGTEPLPYSRILLPTDGQAFTVQGQMYRKICPKGPAPLDAGEGEPETQPW
jgi:hypothetical protein